MRHSKIFIWLLVEQTLKKIKTEVTGSSLRNIRVIALKEEKTATPTMATKPKKAPTAKKPQTKNKPAKTKVNA